MLFDFAKNRHFHVKTGNTVEIAQENNYLFNLQKRKEELTKLFSGTKEGIKISERFLTQVTSEIKNIPPVFDFITF